MPRLSLLVLAGVMATLSSPALAEPLVLPLWPEKDLPKIPEAETVTENEKPDGSRNPAVSFVSQPTLTVFLPEGSSKPVPAVIICPGGGYARLMIDHEGRTIAERLTSLGLAAIVLKYRLPRPDIAGPEAFWPLQDAAQAVRYVRAHAAEWHIDPRGVGIMGFSAGGHLASSLATHYDAGQPGAADPLGRLSSRPDFVALLYPVVSLHDPIAHKGSRERLLGNAPNPRLVDLYSNDSQVTAQTPPTFLAHSRDDRGVPVANSIQFHQALQKAGVPSEIHIFETGGHGFGLRGTPETQQWPALFQAWLKKTGILRP